MGQPGGQANYDREGMKVLSDGTDELGRKIAEMSKTANEATATKAAFGNMGDLTRVKDVFEETWNNLADSLGKGGEHVSGLGRKVDAAYSEQDTRDTDSSQDMGKMQGEM